VAELLLPKRAWAELLSAVAPAVLLLPAAASALASHPSDLFAGSVERTVKAGRDSLCSLTGER
jgi:hypothetical protein